MTSSGTGLDALQGQGNPFLREKVPSAGRVRKILKWLIRIAAGAILLNLLSVLALKWLNPPTSSFMLQRSFSAWMTENENFTLRHEWVPWERISSHVKMAVITAEDQRFADHWGLDLKSMRQAIDEYERGRSLRGASTLTQQLAKNLFLWPGRSWVRKGLEAWFSLLMECILGKRRILELYLNVAEFGNGIYGVEAAGRHFYGKSAENLNRAESALMATVLPSPRRYNLANPSMYMYERQSWILRYMNLLGTERYLGQLN